MKPRWNWAEQRAQRAYLALEDGTVLPGHSVGAPVDAAGEVVFNTGMTGYQEILSDPSYNGQFVVMTHPEIGNTGVNAADMESRRLYANGLIVHRLNEPSSWRSEEPLAGCLRRCAIPAIAGVDTRALTTRLRNMGTLKGFLCATGAIDRAEGVARAKEWCGLDGQDYASHVSCAAPWTWDPDGALSTAWGLPTPLPAAGLHVVAYDFGIKWNILRSLRLEGIDVTIVPARTPAAHALALKPDGVLLSNGPADPAALGYAIETTRRLLGRVPLMGICLGHQILALAAGGRTYKLKFGHHGCNHPVKDLATGQVAVTSQNHNYAVDRDSLDPRRIEVTHVSLNDGTVEGIALTHERAFSIQYHPEACPGPHDARRLFARFRTLITH